MKVLIITSLKVLLAFTIITGFLYPVIVTILSQIVFPGEANGSLIHNRQLIIGSKLIGQKFESDRYFWSRPSAIDYQPLPSAGSNFSPTNQKLKELYEQRRSTFIQKNGLNNSTKIPVEMLFASASGLDPHISVRSAELQAERIAKARGFNADERKKLLKTIYEFWEGPSLFLGDESRVNVLLLNIELDKMFNKE
jgi:K+-transporting ATPase ATPase C chain